MPDELAELFHLHTPDYDADPNYAAVTRALDGCGEEIKAALGQPFFERLSDLEFQRYHIEALAAYQKGFRTAVRLLMA